MYHSIYFMDGGGCEFVVCSTSAFYYLCLANLFCALAYFKTFWLLGMTLTGHTASYDTNSLIMFQSIKWKLRNYIT